MKTMIFNEENEMIRVNINTYSYKKIRSVDSFNGTWDTQEEISFRPNNYNDIILFMKKSGMDINFCIYEDDDKIVFYQPQIEYNNEIQKITLIKLITNFF